MPGNTTITIDQLRAVFFATEDGGDASVLNTFNYAGGSSSYSFGLMQFDVFHNPAAQKFLLDNGFNQKEISKLSQSGGLSKDDLKPLNAKLQAIPQAKIDEFTNGQLQNSITKVDNFIDVLRIRNPAAAQIIADSQDLQLRIADYDNQYHINGNGTKVSPTSPIVQYLSGSRVTFHTGGATMQLAPGEIVTGNDIWEFIEKSTYNASWATDKDNKNPQSHDNRPSVDSREQRLDKALNQLGVNLPSPQRLSPPPQSNVIAPVPSTPFFSSSDVSPPGRMWHDDLGVSPPSHGEDETHGGLF